ncbi:ATP-binding protein [Bordetella genomosp. 13]|uniref:sensor histidine kinase n=1 Tax=Bordetella genomosp. 13 TaxID=463040 RepID=UPI0011A2C39F|nr:ATP-binding protein [Bordetella genomosp. 13]
MGRFMVRSLYWRAFLSVWGAMAVIVACGMLLTAAAAWYRFNSLDGLSPGGLAREAQQVARTQGAEGLERWIRAMSESYSALNIYVVDSEDRDLLGRRLPRRLDDWLNAYRSSQDAVSIPEEQQQMREQPGVRASWWEPQWLRLPDGATLLMLYLPFDSSHWELLSFTPVVVALLAFALAVTAPLCWALTRHITRPLRTLREATRALAQGRLDARTPPELARRRDELGLLARDFDGMADRLQSLVDTREQLLHTVAHELRSPLARLRLATELARRDDDTLALQLDRIERECERLDALVGHTLQLARLSALDTPRAPVDLSHLVDALVQDARFEAGAQRIGIAWTAPAPLWVSGDPQSLASAVDNVLRNALRYAGAAAAIHVALHADEGRLLLDIEDNGPGVPAEHVGNLFEPYFRVPGAASRAKGAGLGLSIARAAVEAHGGSIRARNRKPRGLVVRVELPQVVAQAI